MTSATGAYGQIDYGHDAGSNRTSRAIGAITETLAVDPSSNRLASVDDGTTTRSLGYDAGGNLETDDRGTGLDLDFGSGEWARSARRPPDQ